MVERNTKEMDNWKEIHHSKNAPMQMIIISVFVMYILIAGILIEFNKELGVIVVLGILVCILIIIYLLYYLIKYI